MGHARRLQGPPRADGDLPAEAWRARLLRHLGPRLAAHAFPGHMPPGPMLILPPRHPLPGPAPRRAGALVAGDRASPPLPSWVAGSNNWALAGAHTASGRALVAGDPHRTLDIPNVYYQDHLACPDFDAIGLSFPGCPVSPLRPQSARRLVRHAHGRPTTRTSSSSASIRRRPRRYEFRGEVAAPPRPPPETMGVRGGAGRSRLALTASRTTAPIVLAGPATRAMPSSLRYTATAEPNRTFDASCPMLRAPRPASSRRPCSRGSIRSTTWSSRKPWPRRTIGYRTRGRVPVRHPDNAWLPVPAGTASTSGGGRDPVRGDARRPRSGDRLGGHRQQPGS